MPIITSSIPQMNSAVNVAEENLSLIQRKLTEARDICKDVFAGSRTWQDLFQTRLFFHEFEYFLEITARAKSDLCMWFGLVESKLRTLCVMIRTCSRVQQVQIWPTPFPETNGAAGGFSQSWYIGCSFQEIGEGEDLLERMKEILGSPLRNFSAICDESVRRLAHYPTNSFQTSWTLLTLSMLRPSVTDTLRKKPSYASVTQGLEAPRIVKVEEISGPMRARDDVTGMKTNPFLGLHCNQGPVLGPPQYYPRINSPMHDSMQGAQYMQGRMQHTPSVGGMAAYNGSLRQSPSPVFTSPLLPAVASYPPVTSVPPPYSPANLFTSPPPPHGMAPSPALCRGCNLPPSQCKCVSPRPRIDCSCSSYQDVSGQPQQSVREPRKVGFLGNVKGCILV